MKSAGRYILNYSSIRQSGLILLYLTCFHYSSFAQKSLPETLKPSEKWYSEELYIQTDRELYISGEKVWMKICKLNRLNHTPENISKVVYVEILDDKNNPVNQMKIGIDGFSGSCSIRLPDTLSTGNYFIRSYTNWMQNFSEDFFSYKKISVINPFKIDEIKIPPANQAADSIIFFPEGGNLVTGLEGRIGFKSIDRNGDPVNVRGVIVDSKNDTIARVITAYGGYGWISLKPSQNTMYLVTKDKYGRITRSRLPAPKSEGILLSVPQKGEKSSELVKIRMSSHISSSDSNLFIVMKTAGLPEMKKKLGIWTKGEISISGKDMPEGLAHLDIVDGRDKVLGERWVYNEPAQRINFKITAPKDSFSSREKIILTVTATDDNGNPVESNISVSVVKAVTAGNKSSGIAKLIQLPGLPYYSDSQFSDINDWLIFYNSTDLVSKPDMKFVNGDPPFLPELEGHLISGNIKNRKTGEPIKNENISLSFVGKKALCQFAKTNGKGEFYFKTSASGMKEIVIQPLSESITDYYVDLNNPFNSATKKYNHPPFLPDSARLAEINNIVISTQINNIYEPYLPAGKNIVTREERDFYGKPDNTILLSKYIELTSLKEVVKEIIPGVSTVKKNDKINFKLFYQYMGKPYENNPLVLVDGVPVYDLEKVISINSRDMEKIDVFLTRYYISDIVMEGIIHFVTKKGTLDVIDLDRSAYRVEYDLLQNHNEFYSPDYSTDDQLHGHIPDFRNTLYWNPDVHTGTGKTEVVFYSSDESGEYTITIEGITPDGRIGSATMPLIISGRKDL
jgi:hypothetical protein